MAAPASAVWKLEDDSTFAINCFPARGIARSTHEGTGSWIVAYAHEQQRKLKTTFKPSKQDETIDQKPFASLLAATKAKESTFVNILTEEFLLRHHHVDSYNDLCSINVNDCDLEFDGESNFSNFENVAYVSAAENLLAVKPFSTFPNLRELEMPVNGVRGIDVQPGDFPTLHVLDLSYNNLSSNDMLVLGYLPKLKVLNLTGNGLSQIHPDLCQPFSLTEDSEETFTRFQNLEVLMLDDNRLHDMATFAALAALPCLKELNLDKNEITLVPYLKVVGERVLSACHSYSKSRPPSGKKSKSYKSSQKKTKQSSNKVVSGVLKPMGFETTPVEEKGSSDEPLVTDDKDTAPATDISFDIPSATPPFQQLRILSLANNKISEEEHLLSVAAWPSLQALVLHGNPLVNNSKGEPPLLSQYLRKRLGISIIRFKPKAPVLKPVLRMPAQDRRRVSSLVPKILKQPIDVMLECFKKPAIEHLPHPPHQPKLNNIDVEKKEILNKESDEDNVFLTQIQDETGAESGRSNQVTKSSESKVIDEDETEYQIMNDILKDAKPDPDFHENLSIQGNVKMLRQILDHPIAVATVKAPPEERLRKFKYDDRTHVTIERLKHDIRSHPKPSSKMNKSKKLNDALSWMRNKPTAAVELPLIDALNESKGKHVQVEAAQLLGEIEIKYRVVREESLRASRQARKELAETKAEIANLQKTLME